MSASRLIWFVLVALVVGTLGVAFGASLNSDATTSTAVGMNSQQLQDEKLKQEIRELEIGNAQSVSIQQTILEWAPFATAFGGIIAVGAALWKNASELEASRKQLSVEYEKSRIAQDQWRDQFIEDQRKVRVQEQEEALRRFDTNLSSVITNLGAASETLQVNAAAALGTYLKPRYSPFHSDLLVVLCANLRLRPTDAVARMLGSDLERLLRLMLSKPPGVDYDFPSHLDLSRASLQRLDVSNIDFDGVIVDVAFADMTDANLVEASLFRLKGRETCLEGAHCSRANLGEARLDGARLAGALLHKTNLVSATLKEADLRKAQFQQARLQEAHLEGSDLRGADLTGANVANTYFRNAKFDEIALRSIATGALSWRDNKNFDSSTRDLLERFSH